MAHAQGLRFTTSLQTTNGLSMQWSNGVAGQAYTCGMKGSVPEFGLFSISRICFVKTGSAFRDPFTHGRYAFIPALNHPRSVKYKRARQKANSYQYYENVLTD
jgi:hypothetical protein